MPLTGSSQAGNFSSQSISVRPPLGLSHFVDVLIGAVITLWLLDGSPGLYSHGNLSGDEAQSVSPRAWVAVGVALLALRTGRRKYHVHLVKDRGTVQSRCLRPLPAVFDF